VAGGIDEVQLELLTLAISIGEGDRLAFDGDSPLPLYVHSIGHLFAELAVIDQTGHFDQAVSQGRFSVIDVGNNTEVSNMAHRCRLLPRWGQGRYQPQVK